MKLNFINLEKKLWQGLQELSDFYPFEQASDGIPGETERGEKISVLSSGECVKIIYPSDTAFFRALKLFFLHREKETDFRVEETVCIPECGVMLDLSRNGVMTVEAVKAYIRYMAVMGLNCLHLYMEDVYPLPGHDYFGYMRGRYSAEELREIDRYALLFGIEVIPDIQTLGHMEQYIKWDEGMQYRDTERILIAGEDRTYALIEDMLRSLSGIFTSRRVHLGMDEAGALGTGFYYSKHGHVDRLQIMLSHLERVLKIAEKYQLEPIVYGDMFFALSNGDQFENASKVTALPETVAEKINQKMSIVCWNYSVTDQKVYEEKLKSYQAITKNVIFWGGLWTWFGFLPDNRFVLDTSVPALMACKKTGITSAIGSIWGDNGTECNHFLSMLGMQLYAEHMYHAEVPEELLRQHFNVFTGGDYDAFVRMSDFHNRFTPEKYFSSYDKRYYGKRYFWCDIIEGMMDWDLQNEPMTQHYQALRDDMLRYRQTNPSWGEWYAYAAEICDLLALKCYIGENLKKAYDEKNHTFLKECVQSLLPELKEKYRHMRNTHKEQWLKTYKPFGWEVLDVRYGGMVNRIDYAGERLMRYLNGEIEKIEELEEVRLPHRCEWSQKNFSSIVTACYCI